MNGYGNFGADIIANGGLDAEFTFNDDLQRRIAGWLVTNFHRVAPFTNPQKQAVANWVSGNYRPPASQII